MYDTSEDAMADHTQIDIKRAAAELKRHGCTIVGMQGPTNHRILVTNDCDEPEWIRCTPSAILTWLGY